MLIARPIKHFFNDPSRSFGNLRYRLRESWRWKTAQINPHPIFIFGNQKAGTSAIAALLGEATGLSYTIDILCLYEGLEERLLKGESSFDEVIYKGRYYFSKDIIKDPGLTFFYDELAVHFPSVKRVFVLRDPRQNIRSILNRLRLPGHLEDLTPEQMQRVRQKLPGWYLLLDGSWAGHKGNTYIETLALRCKQVLQLYCQYQAELVPIYYEAFNQDKVNSIHQLAHQLGLPIIQTIDSIKDVQFQPKGDTKLTPAQFFGPVNLQRIEAICGDAMLAAGYTL